MFRGVNQGLFGTQLEVWMQWKRSLFPLLQVKAFGALEMLPEPDGKEVETHLTVDGFIA